MCVCVCVRACVCVVSVNVVCMCVWCVLPLPHYIALVKAVSLDLMQSVFQSTTE